MNYWNGMGMEPTELKAEDILHGLTMLERRLEAVRTTYLMNWSTWVVLRRYAREHGFNVAYRRIVAGRRRRLLDNSRVVCRPEYGDGWIVALAANGTFKSYRIEVTP